MRQRQVKANARSSIYRNRRIHRLSRDPWRPAERPRRTVACERTEACAGRRFAQPAQPTQGRNSREILALLNRQVATPGLSAPPIVRRASGEPAPLSFAQERLWFLNRLEPRSTAYNICRAVKLTGQLDVGALARALDEIPRRHDALRTALRLVDGAPLQIVEPEGENELPTADLSALPTDQRAAEMQRRIAAEMALPFDLFAGKLLRATLLRLSAEKHALILSTHHSVADAWSMGIVMAELGQLYDAFCRGRPSPLAELAVRYADYAVWQRAWLSPAVMEPQLAYWKKRLANLAPLDLPSDRPRPARQSYRGARVPIALPESLTAALNDLSHRLALTPFMTLLAAWQVLLHRYSGQTDIAIGTAVANRQRPEVEGVIGLFVNSLVLRGDLSGDPSFTELLRRVKESWLGADAHRDLPFEKLVQELQPERDLSRNPLFQVQFVLQNATRRTTGVAGLAIEPIETSTVHSPFDLSISLREQECRYIGYIDYSTDLFDGERIERMAGHFQTLLSAIVADPDQAIATLPLLTEAERQQVLVQWNDTSADYPADRGIHQWFEQQVERTPDAVAIECEDRSISYMQLNERANRLAHHLIGLGVGPEKLVAIAIERSIDLVVGLLAILKTGGAYLPLDSNYPAERLRFMIEDSQTSVLLTQEKIAESQGWQSRDGAQLVCLDGDWPTIERHSDDNPDRVVAPNQLAYVIYTSGSSGQPKGVEIEHRAVVNCLTAIDRQIAFSAGAIWLAVTTISFDIAALELFLPLCKGARIILAGRQECGDGAKLMARVASSGANIIQATPSLWQLLCDRGWRSPAGFTVLCGGEALPGALAERLLDGAAALWNLYGPSEATIWSTMARITKEQKTIAIGRPIANTEIYILDKSLQPVAIGIAGELYIGGAGLARGYRNRQDLTEEKFIAHPFSVDSQARLYRTGDWARYRTDGEIEFLGRFDQQVKIRGQRIELGEIEAALRRHPAVKEAVLVARARGSSAEKEIVAYIVCREAPVPSVSELRGFLQLTLPDAMVPSAFVAIERLPLTPNRKIDRNALPLPDRDRPALEPQFIAPRSELEAVIAQVWRDLLQRDAIGVDDNFFDLGGHSLVAAAAIARIGAIIGQEISLRDFFDAPNVAGLARLVEAAATQHQRRALPPLTRTPRGQPMPLSMAQRQLWQLDQLLPGTYFLNMPYAYRLRGALDRAALHQSLGEIVRRHEALRLRVTEIAERAGRPVQIASAVTSVELPIVDLSELAAEERDQALKKISEEDARLPFDLETELPIRFQLAAVTDQEHALLVTVHHIVCDDGSMQLFWRELATLYAAFSAGQPSPLSEPPCQFVDFLSWQNLIMKKRLLTAQLNYWKKQLAGPVRPLRLINATKRRRAISFGAASQPIEIGAELYRDLSALARANHCTLFMVVTALIDLLLQRYSGSRDIRVGTTVSGRRHQETEQTIGNFLNTVILRAVIDPDMSFKELLAQVRRASLEALAHRDLPFGRVAQALARATKKKPAPSPFQVMIIYNQAPPPSAAASNLQFTPWGGKARRSQPDVMLSTLELIFDFRDLTTKLSGSLHYKSDLFSAAAAGEMIESFYRMATQAAAEPRQSITGLFVQTGATFETVK